MGTYLRRAALVALLVAIGGAAQAQVPGLVNQEGLLVDEDGLPIEGDVDLGFALYAQAQGGAPIWSETHRGVALQGGYYSVLLGATVPLTPAVVSGAQYLQLEVDGDRLEPRTRLAAVPYALVAQSLRGGAVDAVTVAVGGNVVIDANGRWVGNPAGLQGPQGPVGPAGPQGPPGPAGNGGGGVADTPEQILAKLQQLAPPLELTVERAADADRLGGRLPNAYLAKSESGVDIANGGLTIDKSTVVFKSTDARDRIGEVQGTAVVSNDAQANALVIAGRRGANANDRRIELRGATRFAGNVVTTGSTVMQGGVFVADANGVPRQIIDNQGRWVPNANPLAGNQCPAGQAFRGVADNGQILCQEAGNALAGCGIPIPCNVANGWGQYEYDEENDVWSACLTKQCFEPARLIVPDPQRPWLNYCRIDENTNDRCQDGVDNDGDNVVDCNDPDCLRDVDVDVCNLADLEVPFPNPSFDPEVEEGPDNPPMLNTRNINNAAHGVSFGVADAPQYRLTNTVSALATTMTLDRVPADLTPGDELLVIALKKNTSPNASNIGRYEVVQLEAINNTQVVLQRGLRYYYDGVRDRVMVQRVPTYRHVTIRNGGVLTAEGWNGTQGGVLAFRAVGTLTIEEGGLIDMSEKGFGGARSAAAPNPAAGILPPTTVGQADNYDGLVTAGGGNGSLQNGGGTPDANGRGGNGGTCPARVPVVNPLAAGVAGQAGAAGQMCNSNSNSTYMRSGGGGAPRNPGSQLTTAAGAPGRIYLGGGGANGGGGGGAGNWTTGGNTTCRGTPGRQDGLGGAAGSLSCPSDQPNFRGGPGGNGTSGGHGGGIVLIWADTVVANHGVTIKAAGGTGGAAGGGGGGTYYIGGGGGGAGGGGAGGGVVLIRANVRQIGAANIDVSGGAGGGGGGGGGSGDGGVGGAGAGPNGGGGGPGLVTRQTGCGVVAGWSDPAAGGHAGQAGAEQDLHDDTTACQIFNGNNAGSFPSSITRAPCAGRGGAVGGGGGGGGLQKNLPGGANQGGQIAPPPPAPGPFCHQFTTGGVTYENVPGGNAPGRDGGNGGNGRQFTAGGGGGRRGPDGKNGVKLITSL